MTHVSDFTKPQKEIIVDLINFSNTSNIAAAAIELGSPVVVEDRQVQVNVTHVPGSGYGGSVEVFYDRLDIQAFCDVVLPGGLTLPEGEAETLADFLPLINAALGINLSAADIVDQPIEGWSGQPGSFLDMNMVVAANSLVYFGALALRIDDSDIDLSTVLTNRILSGLNLPVPEHQSRIGTLLATAYLDDFTALTILRVFDADAGTTLFTSEQFGTPQFGSPFNMHCGVSIDGAYVSISTNGLTRIYRTSDWGYVTVSSNYAITFAPDGRAYADTGEVDPATGIVTPFDFSPAWTGSTEVSADGRLMVGRRPWPSNEVVAYDLNSGTPDALGPVINSRVHADYDAYFRFSQDGRFLAISHANLSGDWTISLLDAASGAEVFSGAAGAVTPVEFSVDGGVLYLPNEQIDTATFARSSWVVPMAYGNPFAPTIFVRGFDLAVKSLEYNSSFSPNTSGYVVSTQVQDSPPWYDLPTSPKWAATVWGIPPVIPSF